MKTIVFQQVAVKEYVSPAMTTMQLCSEGVLCGSVNGILDLDYIYDEEDKEQSHEEDSVFNFGSCCDSMRLRA